MGVGRALCLCGLAVLPLVASADPWKVDRLAEVQIDGQTARIHTQGLYVTPEHYWVTGRLETTPKRALLLRFSRRDPGTYEYLDITPPGQPSLDHPGGFDRDARGTFWIPVSSSHSRGPTIVYGFEVRADRPLDAACQVRTSFSIQDHLGAVACDEDELLAANWDTETVYFLSQQGEVLKKEPRSTFFARLPGLVLAVQDWKFDQQKLITGGIDKSPTRGGDVSSAIVALLDRPRRRARFLRLPVREGASRPMTNEGLAVHDGQLFLLPDDLGDGAKIYHCSLEALGLDLSRPAASHR